MAHQSFAVLFACLVAPRPVEPDRTVFRSDDLAANGVGSRTAPKLRSFDLHVIETLVPDVFILEVGTNDQSRARPEVVGSYIDYFVHSILSNSSVKVLGVCHVIPRGASFPDADQFARMAAVLNYYVSVVLETLPSVFCWTHRDFTSPLKDLYLPDGVHLNPTGQYLLYISYRGAILHALRSLWSYRPLLLSPHWPHFIVYSIFMFSWRRRLLPHFGFPFGFCFTTGLLLLGLSFDHLGLFPHFGMSGLNAWIPCCCWITGTLRGRL